MNKLTLTKEIGSSFSKLLLLVSILLLTCCSPAMTEQPLRISDTPEANHFDATETPSQIVQTKIPTPTLEATETQNKENTPTPTNGRCAHVQSQGPDMEILARFSLNLSLFRDAHSISKRA